ncbi:NupC/NupG family nucleoside CNT transporter [bacterium]|nr:NupC/NupG family nucleoside CNT transporter [bacterium]
MLLRLISFFGVFALMGLAFLLSNNRKKINKRTIGFGISLQFLFALIILKSSIGKNIFAGARIAVTKLLSFTDHGAEFLFGKLYLGVDGIAETMGKGGPFLLTDSSTGALTEIGPIFAFHVLPTIIFFASLMGVLYHLGVMQKLVKGLAWVMTRFMGVSGAEALSAASNIFVGQTEAPFVVAPFLPKMTRSELMAIMTGGFATVAGGVMAAYVRFGIDPGHLLAASVMSAPAALVIAKIMYPETQVAATAGKVEVNLKKESSNVIDAAASGAAAGLKLAANVGAMLLAFIALIAMINAILGLVHLSLKDILGYAFSPLAFVMGVDFKDLFEIGHLLGTKLSLNEFVAYIDLAALKDTITPRSYVIATYALCGFANFSSIAIQIGGIGSIVPERRHELAKLGLKAMFGGALASWMTACIAGVLL